MAGSISPHFQKINSQTSSYKFQKDVWFVAREGSLDDVELALVLLKKNGGNINARNSFGLTPLHIATWRNHVPIVRRLLDAGADPDIRDWESGWSSLHRAFHFGHLVIAGILIQSGASVTLEDSKSRMPVDLISGPVIQEVGRDAGSVSTELFSWGSGVNYQLGTGNAHIQKLACKVESFNGSFIKFISAAKFHSVAVTSRGEVYTWGFGRGGRLGHSDFDIHSGQAAIITPRQITFGLGSRCVKIVSAAKHHTVIATDGGEVFTWGSNREGQLGYTSVDTQPTPRRVTSLRSKVISVAAANKHTAVVSDSGEVLTWGCNREGQLGYGTSNSASNYIPRAVESLKGKVIAVVAAAKYHTIVLGVDGEVLTWGHRLVTPKRVVISRNIKKNDGTLLKFHRMERLHVISVAAGMVHSTALTVDGTLFYWVSSDPSLQSKQIYSFYGKQLVSISAGKYWTAGVTHKGDVYMFDGKESRDKLPAPVRINGAKKVDMVAVGETHILVSSSLYHPSYIPHMNINLDEVLCNDLEMSNEYYLPDDIEPCQTDVEVAFSEIRCAPSLMSLCEKVCAQFLVEPRNSIQILDIIESVRADTLRKYCEDICIRNLDYIFTVSVHGIYNVSLDVLANVERLLWSRSTETWSCRGIPCPTSTHPLVFGGVENGNEYEHIKALDHHSVEAVSYKTDKPGLGYFLPCNSSTNQDINKLVRALRKKLQQIEILEVKQSGGRRLDEQQIAKVNMKFDVERSLTEISSPSKVTDFASPASVSRVVPVIRGNKKVGLSIKHHRNKHMDSFTKTCDSNMGRGKAHFIENPAKDIGNEINYTGAVVNYPALSSKLEGHSITQNKNSNLLEKQFKTKKKKKGGLSLFLSGELEDIPREITLPLRETDHGGPPAWGGANSPNGWTSATSLREIQDEQSGRMAMGKLHMNKDEVVSKPLDRVEEDHKEGVSVSSPSHPVPIMSASTIVHGLEEERSTPPWARSQTPLLHSRPSLRDIQMQQAKKQQKMSQNLESGVREVSVAPKSGGGGGPSSCWFKEEKDDMQKSSLRSIQIEERAIKDLKRFYNTVKLLLL